MKADYIENAGITGVIWAMLESALFAAVLGRLIWHLRLVKKGERTLLGLDGLLSETVGVFAGWIVGSGLAAYLGLDGSAAQGLVLIVSYIGPEGFQALLEKYVSGGRKP